MLANRLKLLRTEKDLKQSDLANLINVTRSTYGHYETEHAVPSIDSLEKLSDFFNVSVDYLLGRSDIRTPNYQEDNSELNAPLANKIMGLSTESKKELEKYIELLKIKDQVDESKDQQSSALEKEA